MKRCVIRAVTAMEMKDKEDFFVTVIIPSSATDKFNYNLPKPIDLRYKEWYCGVHSFEKPVCLGKTFKEDKIAFPYARFGDTSAYVIKIEEESVEENSAEDTSAEASGSGGSGSGGAGAVKAATGAQTTSAETDGREGGEDDVRKLTIENIFGQAIKYSKSPAMYTNKYLQVTYGPELALPYTTTQRGLQKLDNFFLVDGSKMIMAITGVTPKEPFYFLIEYDKTYSMKELVVEMASQLNSYLTKEHAADRIDFGKLANGSHLFIDYAVSSIRDARYHFFFRYPLQEKDQLYMFLKADFIEPVLVDGQLQNVLYSCISSEKHISEVHNVQYIKCLKKIVNEFTFQICDKLSDPIIFDDFHDGVCIKLHFKHK